MTRHSNSCELDFCYSTVRASAKAYKCAWAQTFHWSQRRLRRNQGSISCELGLTRVGHVYSPRFTEPSRQTTPRSLTKDCSFQALGIRSELLMDQQWVWASTQLILTTRRSPMASTKVPTPCLFAALWMTQRLRPCGVLAATTP